MTLTKLWRIRESPHHEFASGTRIGTWSKVKICTNSKCSGWIWRRVSPLIVEWTLANAREPIGDFMWPGLVDEDIVCKQIVLDYLLEHGVRGIATEEVIFIHPRTKKTSASVRASRTGVDIPFIGLRAEAVVTPDRGRSTITVLHECPDCGYIAHEVDHVERMSLCEKDIIDGAPRKRLRRRRRPAGKGALVPQAELERLGMDVVSLRPFKTGLIVTDRVIELLQASSFTNIAWEEIGETF